MQSRLDGLFPTVSPSLTLAAGACLSVYLCPSVRLVCAYLPGCLCAFLCLRDEGKGLGFFSLPFVFLDRYNLKSRPDRIDDRRLSRSGRF